MKLRFSLILFWAASLLALTAYIALPEQTFLLICVATGLAAVGLSIVAVFRRSDALRRRCKILWEEFWNLVSGL